MAIPHKIQMAGWLGALPHLTGVGGENGQHHRLCNKAILESAVVLVVPTTNHWKRFRVCERKGKGLPGTALADDSWLRLRDFRRNSIRVAWPIHSLTSQPVALSWKALGAHFFLTVKSSIGQQHYIMSSTEETSADMPTQEQQQQQQTIEGMDAVRDYERHRDGDEENLTEA